MLISTEWYREMELYMKYAWTALHTQKKPIVEDIPPNKAQLLSRISVEPFDGGKTRDWMSSLSTPIFRAMRSSCGHIVHVVSDRPFEDLTDDLVQGLKLMAWMSKRPITWYWWDHDWERILPKNMIPGKEHINGGWAIPGVLEINVYRREEVHKVLLHESIHALNMDVHMPIRVRNMFHTDLQRQLWPHLGEAFTEFFAEWLWSLADAKSISDAVVRWEYQRACSEDQANIVWSRIHDKTYSEDTNVFAYYVLKWTLMQHEMEVLMNPTRSVSQWFEWWKEVQPTLRIDVAKESNVSLGMTCPT
jgi:hypothetical protein